MLQRVARIIQPGCLARQQLLNVMLANLASSLRCEDIDIDQCRDRLKRVAIAFETQGHTLSDKFYQLLVDEMQANSSGWYQREPDLGAHLDDLLLCVADQYGVAAWMGSPDSDLFRDADQAARACDELNEMLENARQDNDSDVRALGASVGKPAMDGMPARPLWVTPFTSRIAELVDRAADRPASGWANQLCAVMGLSHIRLGSPVIAVILDRTVRELLSDEQARLAGPTPFEAGGFKHYRHYPSIRPDAPDGFGRTYELDRTMRSRADESAPSGAAEAIRVPMVVRDVLEFVYIGQTAADPPYDRELDADFIQLVGADASLHSLLESVGRATRLWDCDEDE